MASRDRRRIEVPASYAPSTGWILVGFCILGLIVILSQRSPNPPNVSPRGAAVSGSRWWPGWGAAPSPGASPVPGAPSPAGSPGGPDRAPSPTPSSAPFGAGDAALAPGAEREGWREVEAAEPDAEVVGLAPSLVEDSARRQALEVQLRSVPLVTREQLENALGIIEGREGGALPGNSTRRAAVEALLASPSPDASEFLIRAYESAGARTDSEEADWLRGRILGALLPEKDLHSGRVARFLGELLAREAPLAESDAGARVRAEQAAFALAARSRLEGENLASLLRAAGGNDAARRQLRSAWKRLGS